MGYIKRIYNGIRRFLKRLLSLWYLHIFFVGLFVFLLLINMLKIFDSFDSDNYIAEFFGIVVIVYGLEFLYSEYDRRESANKRYTIDIDIANISNKYTLLLEILLANENEYRADLSNLVSSDEQQDFKEIKNLVDKEKFWDTLVDLRQHVGHTYLISKRDLLRKIVQEIKEKVNEILIRYSNIIFYEDFKRLHTLDHTIKDFYFSDDIDFGEVNQLCMGVSLRSLLTDLKELSNALDKWKD